MVHSHSFQRYLTESKEIKESKEIIFMMILSDGDLSLCLAAISNFEGFLHKNIFSCKKKKPQSVIMVENVNCW